MVAEVLEHLAPERGGVFVDCTVGLGGHARALLEAGASRVIGLDRDPSALERSRDALAAFGAQVELVHGDYRELIGVLDARGIGGVDGVLADLGVSSMQLDAPDRGFSFRRDDVLDMRMDTSQGHTAAEMLATVDEQTLADVIYTHRRGTACPARGAGDSGGAIPGADHHDRAARRRRPPGDSAQGLLADRSGDAHVPGDPHLGESGARGARRLSRRMPSSRLNDGGRMVGDHVPLARGSNREAHLPRAAGGWPRHDPDEAAGDAGTGGSREQCPRTQRQAARGGTDR